VLIDIFIHSWRDVRRPEVKYKPKYCEVKSLDTLTIKPKPVDILPNQIMEARREI